MLDLRFFRSNQNLRRRARCVPRRRRTAHVTLLQRRPKPSGASNLLLALPHPPALPFFHPLPPRQRPPLLRTRQQSSSRHLLPNVCPLLSIRQRLPTTTTPAPSGRGRFGGMHQCAFCGEKVSSLESVLGPRGTQWHKNCLICRAPPPPHPKTQLCI